MQSWKTQQITSNSLEHGSPQPPGCVPLLGCGSGGRVHTSPLAQAAGECVCTQSSIWAVYGGHTWLLLAQMELRACVLIRHSHGTIIIWKPSPPLSVHKSGKVEECWPRSYQENTSIVMGQYRNNKVTICPLTIFEEIDWDFFSSNSILPPPPFSVKSVNGIICYRQEESEFSFTQPLKISSEHSFRAS